MTSSLEEFFNKYKALKNDLVSSYEMLIRTFYPFKNAEPYCKQVYVLQSINLTYDELIKLDQTLKQRNINSIDAYKENF